MSYTVKKIQYGYNQKLKFLLEQHTRKWFWIENRTYGPFDTEKEALDKMQDLIGYPKVVTADYYDEKGRVDCGW